MNASEWARIKEVFNAALQHDAEQRAALVARECDGDATLRAEVERLLAAHGEADRFLDQPPINTPGDTLSGQRLGRYEIGRLLGAGGMGQVYAARDVDLGRDVAVKVALADEAGSRLRREAQHASRLNHPHICTIHEVGSTGTRAYIAMEYVGGQCLRDLIPPGGLPLADVVRCGTQIAGALAHAHEQGVIHRDLKSANVMVTPDGRAKVLDFGLARSIVTPDSSGITAATQTVTAPGTVLGTLAYMAPEMLRGKPASVSTDIWAFGVLLYELACGARPFGGTGFELTAAILQQPVPRSARIPSSLQQIIDRCLARDPRERYTSAREVGSALEALTAAGHAPHARASYDQGRLRWLRTWPARTALAALLIVAAIAGVLTWRSMRTAGPVGLGASGRPAIAVMTFDNRAGAEDSAWLSQGVPNMLLTGLAQTRGLDIVSQQRLREVARQISADLESVRRDQFSELARRAGAGVMVVGGIARSGADIRIDAQLEDLATGRILAAQSVRGSDVFVLVDQLAARIRDDIGLRTAAGIRQVADISTTSLDAYRLYTQGVQAFERYLWDSAQPLLERAVALDPTFADAYLHLAHVNYFLERPALQQEYLRRAAEHVEKLSARQRLILNIEQARSAGDGPTAARTLDQLLETFPDEENGYNFSNQLHNPVHGLVYDPQKLLITAARGASALPASTLTHNLYAYALLMTGRHEEALAEFERNVERAPREPNPYDSLGEAQLVTGNPAGAVESYGRALMLDPQFTNSHAGRAWAFGVLGRFDEALAETPPAGVKAFLLSRVGRYREASRAIDVARRQADVDGNIAEQGQMWLLSALIAIERRDFAGALSDCDSAMTLFMRLPEAIRRARLGIVHTLKGLALVGARKIGDARMEANAAERLFNQTVEPEKWWLNALTGEIALASGAPAAAATAFSAGQPARKMWTDTLHMSLTFLANDLPVRDGLARVARAQHDPARAIQIYVALLSSGPEQKFVSVFEPRYVLEIARLLESTGDRRGALQEYTRFQNLWARADSDAPETLEMRRAVARLSAAR